MLTHPSKVFSASRDSCLKRPISLQNQSSKLHFPFLGSRAASGPCPTFGICHLNMQRRRRDA
jgi:hypothetical protein